MHYSTWGGGGRGCVGLFYCSCHGVAGSIWFGLGDLWLATCWLLR